MYRVFLLSNTLSDLPVVGELPPDLRGVYLRNGHFSGARYWLELRATRRPDIIGLVSLTFILVGVAASLATGDADQAPSVRPRHDVKSHGRDNLHMPSITPSITDNVLRSPRHTTFYLACGLRDGAPIIFVHGWPELSLSWHHQLTCFGNLGFYAVAPDMRGYGRSSIYARHTDYAVEHSVADMLDLLDSLGREKAIWVGHDWGSPVVWSLASHHPERCVGVVNLCVPYIPNGFALQNVVELLDRNVYPESEFPFGQWDYQRYYQEHFDEAVRVHEANVANTVKALFRRGSPEGKGKPGRLAFVRGQGGWFGGAPQAPDLPIDSSVIGEAELSVYVAALQRNGFFGPDAWYMNAEANAEFAGRAVNAGRIDLPVLFLHGDYDYTCETIDSRLAEPMRRNCADLSEVIVHSGHWMAQEQPVAVNAAIARWLAVRFPGLWQVEDAAPVAVIS